MPSAVVKAEMMSSARVHSAQAVQIFQPSTITEHPKARQTHQECSWCSRLVKLGLDTRKNSECLKRKSKLFPTSLFIFNSLVATIILCCPVSPNHSNHLTLFGFNLLFYLICSTIAMVIVILAFWHKPILSYLISLKPVKYKIIVIKSFNTFY